MFSNTTARPRCFISFGEAAEGLITAPSGERFPVRMAIPAADFSGLSTLRITRSS